MLIINLCANSFASFGCTRSIITSSTYYLITTKYSSMIVNLLAIGIFLLNFIWCIKSFIHHKRFFFEIVPYGLIMAEVISFYIDQ